MAADRLPITLYTTPTCPDCRALKNWFADRGIEYLEKDLSEPLVMEEARKRTGVRVAPITIIGEEVFYGTFASQKPRIEAALRLPANDAAGAR